jgi:hypothetical protein
MNVRVLFSVILVFILKNINVIKKIKKLHLYPPKRYKYNFFIIFISFNMYIRITI